MKSIRMMIYTQDSFGLGHLRRATHLANALVKMKTDLTILMVVDSPVAPFFELADRIDFVKLPTIIKMEAGVFRSNQLAMDYSAVNAMRSQTICTILKQFDPHLALVDHMPGGANNELLAALQMAEREKLKTKFVLGLRDIIDDPQVTCALWKKEQVYETMERFYDKVLLYSSQDCFPTAEKYQISASITKDVHYCGYVCGGTDVRPQCEQKEIPSVLLIAGGGADGYQLMSAFLDAIELHSAPKQFSSTIVTGPFLPSAHSALIRERAKKLNVHIFKSYHDTLSYVKSADLIVSMAGYNTLAEILSLRKPALVYPRPGPSAEQTMRARLFAERGLITLLDPLKLDSSHFSALILEMLKQPIMPNVGLLPNLEGVRNAAETLIASV